MLARRKLTDLLALTMIGDGALAMTRPREHVSAWRIGVPVWDDAMGFFERRPGLTRMVGAAEVLGGLLLAYEGLDRGSSR